MKKIFVFLVFIIQLQGFCATNVSNNTFDITINDIPSGDGSSEESGGLSGGAVTAITLGSIFGGLAAGGIGYYFYKKGTCLTGACVWDKSDPLIPICGDIIKEYNNYPYLKKQSKAKKFALIVQRKNIFLLKIMLLKIRHLHGFILKTKISPK